MANVALVNPPAPPPSIVLTLSQDEADILRTVLGKVGGHGIARIHTDAIYAALQPQTTRCGDNFSQAGNVWVEKGPATVIRDSEEW